MQLTFNLDDSFINITDAGGDADTPICVNIYAIDSAANIVACCTCTVAPDVPVSASVNNQVLNNTTTGIKPSSVVIKLIASTENSSQVCTPTYVSPEAGLAAWMTTTPVVTTTYAREVWSARKHDHIAGKD